jgi:hypothetical protein
LVIIFHRIPHGSRGAAIGADSTWALSLFS